MEARLDLRLSQKLVMTVQLQQAIKLLQLSRLELNQIISQELLENPLLEDSITDLTDENTNSPSSTSLQGKDEDSEDGKEEAESDGSFKLDWDGYFDLDGEEKSSGYYPMTQDELPNYEQTMAKPTTLMDHLQWQLKLSSSNKKEEEIGTVIIGNLDDDGYLRASTEEIASMVTAKVEDVEKVLKLIQTFDPVGVGARDLKECLVLQIEQLGLKGSLVERIVSEHLPDLEKKKYPCIAKTLGVPIEEIYKTTKVIEGLEPKPGRSFTLKEPQYIVPDVFVIKSGDGYQVILNEDGIPRLRINSFYRQLLKDKKNTPDSLKTYIEERVKSALWLVKSIEQRNRTIYRTVESIVKFQMEFLDKGIAYLKPMVLKDIANDIDMHESTVSRVTTNKYVHTPQGLFELKYFFSSGIQRKEGNDVSSISIREIIRKIISEENGKTPLSDCQIAETLKKKGIEIARRTVAKYRKELKIPSANRRRNYA